MWQTWRMSQDLRKTPSEVLSITGTARQYYFNKAVWRFGTALDSALEEAAKGKKTDKAARTAQQLVLNRWIAKPGQKGLWRDPAGL